MNMYETRSMLMMVRKLAPISTFLRQRYAPQSQVFTTTKVIVEVKDAEQRMAPAIVRRSDGALISRPGESMREYEPFKIGVKLPLTIDDLEERGFGEALFGDMTPEEREGVYLMGDLENANGMLDRREELMVADVLLNNGCKMEAMADDEEKREPVEVCFYSEKKNPAVYTPQTDFDDPDADILAYFDDMATDLKSRGLPATDFVCNPDVARAVVNHPQIAKQLDNRRMELGVVDPQTIGATAALVGTFNAYGNNIALIAYGETYLDPDTKEVKPYIPSGYGFMTAPGSLQMAYGLVTQVEESDGRFHSYPGSPRVPRYLSDAKGNVTTLGLVSKPLVVPTAVNPSISVQALGN